MKLFALLLVLLTLASLSMQGIVGYQLSGRTCLTVKSVEVCVDPAHRLSDSGGENPVKFIAAIPAVLPGPAPVSGVTARAWPTVVPVDGAPSPLPWKPPRARV